MKHLFPKAIINFLFRYFSQSLSTRWCYWWFKRKIFYWTDIYHFLGQFVPLFKIIISSFLLIDNLTLLWVISDFYFFRFFVVWHRYDVNSINCMMAKTFTYIFLYFCIISIINWIWIAIISIYSFWRFLYCLIKGTLMQIWKSPYMFVFRWKQCPGNFPFLILKVLELFAREVCKFLKK